MTTQYYTSNRGRPVRLRRYRTRDGDAPQIELRYGAGTAPGQTVWLPDCPRMQPEITRLLDLFISDHNNLGQPIRIKGPKEHTV